MLTGSLSPVTNRETWVETVYVIDSETDASANITDADIVVEVRDKNSKRSVLSGSTDDGDIIIGTDDNSDMYFTWRFDVDDVRSICPGTYDVGCTIAMAGITTQLFVGTIEIADGVVS